MSEDTVWVKVEVSVAETQYSYEPLASHELIIAGTTTQLAIPNMGGPLSDLFRTTVNDAEQALKVKDSEQEVT